MVDMSSVGATGSQARAGRAWAPDFCPGREVVTHVPLDQYSFEKHAQNPCLVTTLHARGSGNTEHKEQAKLPNILIRDKYSWQLK